MVWALLAILGVPLWLVVGGLAASLWSRKKFKETPGVFPAKVRLESGAFDGIGDKWPRMPAYALWVHDVLLLHKGPALVRTLPLPVSASDGIVQPAESEQIKWLGDDPIVLALKLDNGAVVQLAAPNEARERAVGPFMEIEGE